MEDIRALENIIFEAHEVRAKGDPRKFLPPSPLAVIEEWIVEMISDKIRKNEKISLFDFLADIIKEIIKTVSTFEEKYQYLLEDEKEYIKASKEQFDPTVIKRLEDEADLHPPDSIHVASAIAHPKK